MEHLTRQFDLLPPSATKVPITVIGAGAIGSFTVLSLAKMGFEDITVFDDDTVSIENMNCQFYRFCDIGTPKVKALETIVHWFSKVNIRTIEARYEVGCFPGIVISAVDSMGARRAIWENHKEISPGTKAVIDPRMGAENALLYVMNPMSEKDIVSYEKALYSDEDAYKERCTAKATMYTALLLSGLVCKAVKDLQTTENYLRTAQWDIASNTLHAWAKINGSNYAEK
jgi:molybdopterin/thiamine biosynthesis adenylyltransferase